MRSARSLLPAGAAKLMHSIIECRFTSSSGRQIVSIILRATAFVPKRSKKLALAGRWSSVQSPVERTLSITCWGKPRLGGISSASSSSFPTVEVSRLRRDQ